MRIIEMTGTTSGGVRSHLIDVLGLLTSHHEVALLAPSSVLESLSPAEMSGARAVPVEIAAKPTSRDVRSIATVRTWARNADVIHAHTLRAGALAVLACVALSDPPRIVVTLHNMPVGSAAVRATGEALFRVVAAGADRVLGVSPDLVDKALELGTIADLAIVPARPTPLVVTGPQTRDAATLLTVGRLSHQKGLDILLDAAEIVGEKVLNVRWLVAGDGPYFDELAAEIEERQLPVELLGRRDDVAELLNRTTLAVQTSRWEGQPVAVQEALHAGTALVATDVGGTRVVVGENYPLVAPNPDAIAKDIIELLLEPNKLEQRSELSRARAQTLPGLAELAGQLTNELRLFPPVNR
ncbi:Glycosyltransferase involved in cell wall bisynthesis [Bowdeniella nasicola]|uniref:Glycosyltransferase involved in cell wall bisynthesis n=1 Tax=Bowdeniella nasicola TaxID=208480 RepID=A0A1H4DVG4_9ACTO|nr:glycosyltransferase [Bowdeniella nasicola]SEA76763.1 Glycosyltransferase involved in cell wall bisynthesis [Bowdeniella nasicola]